LAEMLSDIHAKPLEQDGEMLDEFEHLRRSHLQGKQSARCSMVASPSRATSSRNSARNVATPSRATSSRNSTRSVLPSGSSSRRNSTGSVFPSSIGSSRRNSTGSVPSRSTHFTAF
jgi:hypothetical protein